MLSRYLHGLTILTTQNSPIWCRSLPTWLKLTTCEGCWMEGYKEVAIVIQVRVCGSCAALCSSLVIPNVHSWTLVDRCRSCIPTPTLYHINTHTIRHSCGSTHSCERLLHIPCLYCEYRASPSCCSRCQHGDLRVLPTGTLTIVHCTQSLFSACRYNWPPESNSA